MSKKILIALGTVLVITLGVVGFVGTTYAQDIDTDSESVDALSEPEQATFEYEYANQAGEQNGEDPIMTQTRTRLREDQVDGECTGDGDMLQVRQQLGAQGEGQQQRLNLGDGTCDGTGLGDGTCDGTGTPQRMQGGQGGRGN
jgi:hypothetical protein